MTTRLGGRTQAGRGRARQARDALDMGPVPLRPICPLPRSSDHASGAWYIRDNGAGDFVKLETRDAKSGRAVRASVKGPLQRMAAQGVIGFEEVSVGEAFERLFKRAGYGPQYARVDLFRLPGASLDAPGTDRAAEARQRVNRLLQALGASDPYPMGWPSMPSLVWNVLGIGQTLEDWTRDRRAAGYQVTTQRASGMLVSALELLVARWKEIG